MAHLPVRAVWVKFTKTSNDPKLSDGGHEARRLQPRRPAAVRCSAWLGVTFAASPISPFVFALVVTTLFRNLVQNNARCCAEIQTFDHAEHGNAHAHFTAL